MTNHLFPQSSSCREKTLCNVDRGTFIYSFDMVNMVPDDKQINLIRRIVYNIFGHYIII